MFITILKTLHLFQKQVNMMKIQTVYLVTRRSTNLVAGLTDVVAIFLQYHLLLANTYTCSSSAVHISHVQNNYD